MGSFRPLEEEGEEASAAVFSLYLGFYRGVAPAELPLEPGERSPMQALNFGGSRDASQPAVGLSMAKSLEG